MMWVMWNLTSFCLETVLMSVQDSCMVGARRTIGSTRSSFWPFGHGANLDARYVYGLRRTYHRIGIHFDAPDGTPR